MFFLVLALAFFISMIVAGFLAITFFSGGIGLGIAIGGVAALVILTFDFFIRLKLEEKMLLNNKINEDKILLGNAATAASLRRFYNLLFLESMKLQKQKDEDTVDVESDTDDSASPSASTSPTSSPDCGVAEEVADNTCAASAPPVDPGQVQKEDPTNAVKVTETQVAAAVGDSASTTTIVSSDEGTEKENQLIVYVRKSDGSGGMEQSDILSIPKQGNERGLSDLIVSLFYVQKEDTHEVALMREGVIKAEFFDRNRQKIDLQAEDPKEDLRTARILFFSFKKQPSGPELSGALKVTKKLVDGKEEVDDVKIKSLKNDGDAAAVNEMKFPV